MSCRTGDTILASISNGPKKPPTKELQAIAQLLETDQNREEFRWVLRDALDQAIDAAATGRWCYQQLGKEPKTALGSAVQGLLGDQFKFEDGEQTDWKVLDDEIPLECKWSANWGQWEIPRETYFGQGTPELPGTGDRDHCVLGVWACDDTSKWAAALFVVTHDDLTAPRGNGDRKRQLLAKARNKAYVLWGGLQHDLPPNILLRLDEVDRQAVLSEELSSQGRLRELLRRVDGELIDRPVYSAVAGSYEIIADMDAASSLVRTDGILVLTDSDVDRVIADSLGVFVPTEPGQYVPVAVHPVDERPRSGGAVFLANAWWRRRESTDTLHCEAPPREDFQGDPAEQIVHGPTD